MVEFKREGCTPQTVILNKKFQPAWLIFDLPFYPLLPFDGISGAWNKIQPDMVIVDLVCNQESYKKDPTIRKEEATAQVSRDKPGATALERTIIRWNFDSDPRGSRIFWRVITSIPDEVKNTNELYLTTTPYEETRSFNIMGLTYENSRDVTIEIKVTKSGYEDQVKRYNVRQAIDQQEISGFFELVKKEMINLLKI
jgi:hypothetical protein